MDSSPFPTNVESHKSMDNGKEKEDVESLETPQIGSKRNENPNGTSSLPSKTKKKITRSFVSDYFSRTSSGTFKRLGGCKQHTSWIDSQTQQTLTPENGSVELGRVGEDIFRDACNELLVLGKLPLAFIESLAWRNFSSRVQLYEPHSLRTATRDIVEMYVKKKAATKKILNANKQRLSLTTDMWVAPDTGARYMVITAHFIDESWQFRKLIIGFKHISDHKESTIASVLLDCLADWGIKKIFTITVDNATTNTSDLNKFKSVFKEVGNDALVLNGDYMQMQCCTHVMNSVVRDALKEVENSVAAIRNGVQYVRSSTTRLKSFELRVDTGKMSTNILSLDCKTSWNSTYLMLKRAIKLKVAFEKMEAEDKLYNEYFQESENGKKRIGPPSTTDWKEVKQLVRLLHIFYISTLVVSATNVASSHKCYNEIVTIEYNLRRTSIESGLSLRDMSVDMKAKFDKYWDGLRESNVLLIIASVFDPRYKMKFASFCFEKLYGKDSQVAKELYDSVLDVLKRLFEEYGSKVGSVGGVSSQKTEASTQSGHDNIVDDGFLNWNIYDGYETMESLYIKMINEQMLDDTSNELELYLKEKVINPKTSVDILSWWRINSSNFPVLSEIARDVLAIQVSSVASESAFSTTGRILDPSRSCLTHYMIEVLMCNEQWMKCNTHLDDKGPYTKQQMLADIGLQDELEKEFESLSGNHID